MKAKFSKEMMLGVIDYGPSEEFTELIYDKLVDHGRWTRIHEIVFRYQDRFWKTRYSVGATEGQDIGPWDYQDEVECIQVEPVEVTVTEYREIE